jgi:hypothetical protein
VEIEARIGPLWPIPFHSGCTCFLKVIRPGENSLPFIDFPTAFAGLPDERQQQALGRDPWLLWRAGIVEWKDIALPRSVYLRTLEEIIEHKKLSPEDLVSIGYSADEAGAIWGRVFTPERLAKEKSLRDAVRRLKELGYTIQGSGAKKKKPT